MKKIIHIDMDCFFAAIEMRDNPDYQNLPLAVGGTSDRRGVLCTANYEARKYGVHSAMPTRQALKLCPNLILVKPNSEKYKEASLIIKNIFSKYTDKIEPISIDEAFLDVTDSDHFRGSAQLLAMQIKKEIYEQTKLTASAGVSCNKFIAKIASDWRKPDGLFVVTPKQVDQFVTSLNVSKIPGVGKVMTQKLNGQGIFTCADIRKIPLSHFTLMFGNYGQVLYERAFGIDNREVQISRVRKSLSVERTFSYDKGLQELEDSLKDLECEFTYRLERLRKKNDEESDYLVKQLFLKLKFSDFKTVTAEEKKDEQFLLPLNKENLVSNEIHLFFKKLLKDNFHKSDLKVRLLGIGARFFTPQEKYSGQLDLFSYTDLNDCELAVS